MNRARLVLLGLWVMLTAVAAAGEMTFQQRAVVMDSLSRVHPRMRARWLRERGIEDPYYTTFRRPESTGLACVGRWPWGPSWELAGRDTFLYLGSGSGVRILSIADSVQPRMLGQINARSLVSGLTVQDTLLFVACGSWGAQIYSVSNPADPRELASMDAVIGDLCVKDTFCYTVGGDSLRIYGVADPSRPTQVGAIVDSGDVIEVTHGHAFIGGPGPMNVYDVTDPAHPTWVNSIAGPTYDMFLRRSLLFCTRLASPTRFSILNISDALSITEVGGLSGYAGEGVYANDSFAFVSCIRDHVGLFVVDVSDSSRPRVCDSINPEGVIEWQPYAPSPNSYGYLADDYGGLITLDLHDADSVSQAWAGYQAHEAVDVVVDGQRAYVANQCAGLQILDVSDPTYPVSLGRFDTLGSKQTRTATARDSFAYIGMSGISRREDMRALNVLDPSNPTVVAQESCFNPPEDYVLVDSLLYAAEANQFQVFNVARPREPVRVGSCAAGDATSAGLFIKDTLAFVGNFVSNLVSIQNPASPQVISSFGRGAWNVSVRDTFAFLSSGGILVYSVARPKQPRLLDSLSVGQSTYWVEAVGTLLYIGNPDGVRVVDASEVHDMRVRGFCSAPRAVDRLTYRSPYIYAACWEAGVSIYESTQVAVTEATKGGMPTGLSVRPNPAKTKAVISTFGGSLGKVGVRDIAGRVLPCATTRWPNGDVVLNLTLVPSGVYFVEGSTGVTSARVKFVRQ